MSTRHEDYLSLKNKNSSDGEAHGQTEEINQLYSKIAREVIIPELEREVNEGKHFAQLRQMYHSLILAIWFKRQLKRNIINQVYSDQKKISGIELSEKKVGEKVYEQYMAAIKKGVYDVIREEYNPDTQEVIPRKYFSGGFSLGESTKWWSVRHISFLKTELIRKIKGFGQKTYEYTASLLPLGVTEEGLLSTATADDTEQPINADEEYANPAKFNDLLASIVNGQADISNAKVLGDVFNQVLALHHAGHSAVILERIEAYQKLIEPTSFHTSASPTLSAMEIELRKLRAELTSEQLTTVSYVLDILRNVYLSLEPFKGLQKLNPGTFEVQGERGLHEDISNKVAIRLVQAQDEINATISGFSWEGDVHFSSPVSIKIVEHNEGSKGAIEYFSDQREIRISQSALELEQPEFVKRLQLEIQKFFVQRFTAFFQKEFDTEEAQQLSAKLSTIMEQGTPLSEFILFVNMSEPLSYEKISDFLDRVIQQGELGYDELVKLVDVSEDILKDTGPEYIPSGFFARKLSSVMEFLREHPSAVMVPLALIASVSGALVQESMGHIGNLDLHVDNHNLSAGHLDQNVHVSSEIISRGEPIPPGDQKYFDAMKDLLSYEDVKSLIGKINAPSGTEYKFDTKYINRNWEKIFDSSRYRWPQEVIVIAAQEKLGVKATGDLGPGLRKILEERIAQAGLDDKNQEEVPASSDVQSLSSGGQYDRVIESPPNPLAGGIKNIAQKDGPLSPTKIKPIIAQAEMPPSNPPEIGGASSPPPPPPTAAVSGSLNQPVRNPYAISTQTSAVPQETTLTVQATGDVAGLNENKKEYQPGELMFVLINPNPEIIKQKESLSVQLQTEKDYRTSLEKLQTNGSATMNEIDRSKEKIQNLEKQLAGLNQKLVIQEVKAPTHLIVRNFLVSNGKRADKGSEALTYFNADRIQLTLEIPSTQTYFGQIRLKIDGQPVENVVSVDWSFDPKRSKAIAKIVVIPLTKILTSRTVKVEAEFLPPKNGRPEFESIRGQAQTTSRVPKIEEDVWSAPAGGPVHYYVKEGDRIVPGQLLAEIGAAPYWDEFLKTIQEYNSVHVQLNRTRTGPNGVQHVSQTQRAELEKRKADLWGQVLALQYKLSRLQVVATHRGIVTRVSSMNSSLSLEEDELLRTKKELVFIGDTHEMNKAILLPGNLNLHEGDPILVALPSGIRLPAKITAINRNPTSEKRELGPVQAIQIKVYDPDNSLWENLPLNVIVPTQTEKAVVLAEITRIEKEHTQLEARVQIPAPIKLAFQESRATPNQPLPVKLKSLTSANAPDGRIIKITDIVDGVGQNKFISGPLTLEVLQSRAAEAIPESTRLSLTGGVYYKDEKLTFSGGVGAAINGVMAGISTGNAIGAALPLVFTLAGDIIDAITGKPGQERQLAVLMTEIAQHRMESAVMGQIGQATNLLTEIGRAQQHITRLKAFEEELAKAKQVVDARLSQGFSISAEANSIQNKIIKTKAERSEWQKKRRNATIELNQMLGRPQDQWNEAISPEYAWDGSFGTVTDQELTTMRGKLIPESSVNYQIAQARAALNAVKQTLKLQKMSGLSNVLGLNGLFLTGNKSVSPVFDFISGTKIHTGTLTEGGTAGLSINIPLIDTRQEAEEMIDKYGVSKAEIELAKAVDELVSQLVRAAAKIQSLSPQIAQAEEDLRTVEGFLQEKISKPDLYTEDQLIEDRIKITEGSQRLIDLKAEYFEAETQLRGLQVLDPQETLIGTGVSPSPATEEANVTAEPTTSAASAQMQVQKTDGKLLVVPAQIDQVVTRSSPSKSVENKQVLSAGSVHYPPIDPNAGGGAEAWTLMSQGPTGSSGGSMARVSEILNQDPNAMNRSQAVDLLLKEHQNDARFLETVGEIILTSPYPDVVQRLLLSLAHRPDHDVRFFIHMIDRAIQNKKDELVNWSFQMLSDMFLDDPAVLQKISELTLLSSGTKGKESSYKNISVATARRVLLTFLAWAPNDPIAKGILLHGSWNKEKKQTEGYWTDGQLAQIYASLKTDAGGNEAERQRRESLASLIYKEIFRRKALENIPEVFRKGLFYGPILEGDIFTAFMYEEMSGAFTEFLTTYPDWTRINDYLHEDLRIRAQKATSAFVSIHKSPAAGGELLYDFLDTQRALNSMTTYFDSLNLDAQKMYIAQASHSELARILHTTTSSTRGLVLNRLMETREGRMGALQIYLDTDPQVDSELLELIEQRNWADSLKEDIKAIINSETNAIVRRALEKMADRINSGWPRDISLETYSLPELAVLSEQDDRPKLREQFDQKLIERTVQFVYSRLSYRTLVKAGTEIFPPAQLGILLEIDKLINQTNDPKIVINYINQLMASGDEDTTQFLESLGIGDVIQEVFEWRDKLKSVVEHKGENIPKIPEIYKGTGIFVALIMLIPFARGLKKNVNRKSTTTDDLINGLKASLLYDEQERNTVTKVPANSIDESNRVKLKVWQEIVQGWSVRETEPQTVLDNFNIILTNADYILRGTSYTSELIWDEGHSDSHLNEKYRNTLSYIGLLAVDTLNVLNKTLDEMTLSPLQKEQLLVHVDRLQNVIRYVKDYLVILEYRAIIDGDMPYKFKDVSTKEMSYSVMRFFLLYRRRINKAKKAIQIRLSDLIKLGNSLIPNLYPVTVSRPQFENDKVRLDWQNVFEKLTQHGWAKEVNSNEVQLTANLQQVKGRMSGVFGDHFSKILPVLEHSYQDPKGLVANTKILLDDVVGGGKTLVSMGSPALTRSNKGRKYRSRLVTLGVPGVGALITYLGLQGYTFVPGLSYLGTATMGVSVINFWDNYFDAMQVNWSKNMNEVMRRLKDSLEIKLEGSFKEAESVSEVEKERLVVDQAIKNGMVGLQRELDPKNKPNVDMIVIIPEDPDSVAYLNNYIHDKRGKIFREGIPVEVMTTTKKGSGNAYFEAFQLVKNQIPEWENAKVMFVFHGNNTVKDDKVLDWTIINGYQVSACMGGACQDSPEKSPVQPDNEQNNNGRQIIMYTRDISFIPFQQSKGDDITLTGHWESADKLQDLNLFKLSPGKSAGGPKNQIEEIREKLDLTELIELQKNRTYPKGLYTDLDKNYQLDNRSLRQFPVFSGIKVFGPKTVRLLGNILDTLEAEPALWTQLSYLNMTSDILNVLIKSNGELGKYFSKRLQFADIRNNYTDEQRAVFSSPLSRFYSILEKARDGLAEHLNINAMTPYPGGSVFIHVRERSDVEKAATLIGTSIDAAMLGEQGGPPVLQDRRKADLGQKSEVSESKPKAPTGDYGGLDFTDTEKSIQFNNKAPLGIKPSIPNLPAPSLQLFKGFEFRILGLKALKDPAEFVALR